MNGLCSGTTNDMSIACWVVGQIDVVFHAKMGVLSGVSTILLSASNIHQNQMIFNSSYLKCEWLQLKTL